MPWCGIYNRESALHFHIKAFIKNEQKFNNSVVRLAANFSLIFNIFDVNNCNLYILSSLFLIFSILWPIFWRFLLYFFEKSVVFYFIFNFYLKFFNFYSKFFNFSSIFILNFLKNSPFSGVLLIFLHFWLQNFYSPDLQFGAKMHKIRFKTWIKNEGFLYSKYNKIESRVGL